MNIENALQDGIPSVIPSQGSDLWIYWFADGKISHHVVEISEALPAGHYHVAVRMDETIVRLSNEPVSGEELQTHVRGLVEELSKGASHFVWLPTAVPGSAPQVKHPRRVELS